MSIITTDQNIVAQTLTDNGVSYYEFEINASYDGDLARRWYEDFESGADGVETQIISGNRGAEYIVIYGEGYSPTDTHFKEYKLKAMRKADLIDLADSLGIWAYDMSNGKQEIIDDLMYLSHEDYYEKHYSNTGWRDTDCDFVATGYCQGDACAVKVLGKYHNMTLDSAEDHITHLLYDCPVYARINVFCNKEAVDEIYIDEHLKDTYKWDRGEALQVLENIVSDDEPYKDLLMSWARDNVPQQIEYSD